MKFAQGKYTKAQREWCERYERETGFDPHATGDYEVGNKTFVEAAKDCVSWFEDWSGDAYLRITEGGIPGDE